MEYRNRVNTIFTTVFGDHIRKKFESVILSLAGLGFLIHLLLIALKANEVYFLAGTNSSLLNDPITAIYTPFSLILIYEVYLLVFYLPRSFTSCVSKQFEIISLILPFLVTTISSFDFEAEIYLDFDFIVEQGVEVSLELL